MEKQEEYSVSFLERCSYRILQHLAKSLQLPSNVKKIYLIQLIYAKKNCTEHEVNSIVQRVRAERQQLAQTNNRKKNAKRLRLQAAEISSTNNTFSPPIDLTPKGAGLVKSPGNRYRQNILNTVQTYSTQSDRVLRSFNLRTYKKSSNYDILNSSLANLLEYPRRPQAHISIIRQETKNPKVNMTRCVVRKYKPSQLKECKSLMPVNRNVMNIPMRRQQRALSGIYPLPPHMPVTQTNTDFECIQSVGYRRNDGKLSKINAVVQKNALNTNYMNNTSYASIDYNISESASKAISTLTERLLLNYPNMSVTKEPSIDLTESDDEALNLVQLKNKYTNTEYIKNNNSTLTQMIKINDSAKNHFVVSSIEKQIETELNDTKETAENQEFKTITNQIVNANSDFHETESTLSRVTTLSDSNPYQSLDNNQCSISSSKCNKSSSGQESYSSVSSTQNLTATTSVTDSVMLDDDTIILTSKESNIPALTDLALTINENVTYNTQLYSKNESVTQNQEAGYYHKKIRAERGRNQRLSFRDTSDHVEGLPRISYVFSKFNDYAKNISQPLYVQVDDDARQLPAPQLYTSSNQKPILETLYTLSLQLPPALTLAPPIKIANVKSVYTTPCIPTAILQPSKFGIEQTQAYPHDKGNYQIVVNEQLSRNCDYFTMPEQEITLRNYQEVAPSETSSADQHDPNVTIPEMIEDALEIMSQDGDYMERIGMDVRMQCILCSWAGPKIILEYHIRKEHQNQILNQERSEWCISLSLSLMRPQQVWLSHVAEYNGRLYATSVRQHSLYIMATLQSISSEYEPKKGSLTIFNRATGEPFIWNGTVQDISTNMPFESECETLVVPQNQINDTHVTVLVNICN